MVCQCTAYLSLHKCPHPHICAQPIYGRCPCSMPCQWCTACVCRVFHICWHLYICHIQPICCRCCGISCHWCSASSPCELHMSPLLHICFAPVQGLHVIYAHLHIFHMQPINGCCFCAVACLRCSAHCCRVLLSYLCRPIRQWPIYGYMWSASPKCLQDLHMYVHAHLHVLYLQPTGGRRVHDVARQRSSTCFFP